jgi:hypothetical protein
MLGRNLASEARSIFHHRRNDIIYCFGQIDANTWDEELIFRGLVQFSEADKSIGEEDTLVIASPLDSYILSISILINALKLTKGEIDFLGLKNRKEECEEILKNFKHLRVVLDKIEAQFALEGSE